MKLLSRRAVLLLAFVPTLAVMVPGEEVKHDGTQLDPPEVVSTMQAEGETRFTFNTNLGPGSNVDASAEWKNGSGPPRIDTLPLTGFRSERCTHGNFGGPPDHTHTTSFEPTVNLIIDIDTAGGPGASGSVKVFTETSVQYEVNSSGTIILVESRKQTVTVNHTGTVAPSLVVGEGTDAGKSTIKTSGDESKSAAHVKFNVNEKIKVEAVYDGSVVIQLRAFTRIVWDVLDEGLTGTAHGQAAIDGKFGDKDCDSKKTKKKK